jgi:hypothetical protein
MLSGGRGGDGCEVMYQFQTVFDPVNMFNHGAPCCCNLLLPQYCKAVTTLLHFLLLADIEGAHIVTATLVRDIICCCNAVCLTLRVNDAQIGDRSEQCTHVNGFSGLGAVLNGVVLKF